MKGWGIEVNNKKETKKFIKKIYTVAYRLTGNEEAACDLAEAAVIKSALKYGWEYDSLDYLLKFAAAEICRDFLKNYNLYSVYDGEILTRLNYSDKQNKNMLQNAILNLEPINRVALIWRDVLGFKITELLTAVKGTESYMNTELSYARHQLKKQLNEKNSNSDEADLLLC